MLVHAVFTSRVGIIIPVLQMRRQVGRGGVRVTAGLGQSQDGKPGRPRSRPCTCCSPSPSPSPDKCPSCGILPAQRCGCPSARQSAGCEVTKCVCLEPEPSALSLCRQPPAPGLPQPQGVGGGDGWVCEFAHADAVLLSEVCDPEEIQPDPLAPCPWLVLPVGGLWVSPGAKPCPSCLPPHLSLLSSF